MARSPKPLCGLGQMRAALNLANIINNVHSPANIGILLASGTLGKKRGRGSANKRIFVLDIAKCHDFGECHR